MAGCIAFYQTSHVRPRTNPASDLFYEVLLLHDPGLWWALGSTALSVFRGQVQVGSALSCSELSCLPPDNKVTVCLILSEEKADDQLPSPSQH